MYNPGHARYVHEQQSTRKASYGAGGGGRSSERATAVNGRVPALVESDARDLCERSHVRGSDAAGARVSGIAAAEAQKEKEGEREEEWCCWTPITLACFSRMAALQAIASRHDLASCHRSMPPFRL